MKKYILVLFVVLFLIFGVEAQKGGGGKSWVLQLFKGGSRTRWGRTSSNYQWISQNTTFCNKTVTTDCTDPNLGYYILYLLSGVGFIGYKVYSYLENKSNKKREEQINKIFDQFEHKNTQAHHIDQIGKTKVKDWFMSNKWKIKYKQLTKKRNSLPIEVEVDIQLEGIVQRKEFSYEITMKMSDSVGKSRARGILIHKQDHLIIKFQKTYDNRSNAGQKDEFSILLYEGHQKGEQFVGSWSYKNFEKNPFYSGQWRMYHT